MSLRALAQQSREDRGTAPRHALFGAARVDGARQLEGNIRHAPAMEHRLFRSLFQIWLPACDAIGAAYPTATVTGAEAMPFSPLQQYLNIR
jgi:hypothetical protein